MKLKSILAVLLSLLLITGCSSRNITTNQEPNTTPPPALQPTQDPPETTAEPPVTKGETTKNQATPKQSDLKVLEPEHTIPPNVPLLDVKVPSDEQAIFSLYRPLDELEHYDAASIVWGHGVTSNETRPSEPVKLQSLYGSMGGYFIMPDTNEIYLSFDEGYELGYTPLILDILKEKDVKAVFFITLHYAKSRPDLVRRMIDEGHIIGNHSANHPIGGMPSLTATAMAKDILTLHGFVAENFDYQMTLFRPPEGTFSEQSLMVLESLGYKSVFWSFTYRDWDPDNQPDLQSALSTIVGSSHPGAIYLLHGVSASSTSVLSQAIDDIRDKGYSFSDWSQIL